MEVTEIIINVDLHSIALVYENGSFWYEVTTAINENESFKDFHYHIEGTGDLNIWKSPYTGQVEGFINGYGVKLTIKQPVTL